MGATNRPKIQMGLLSAEDTHHGSLSRLPGLRIGTRRAFSPVLVGRTMAPCGGLPAYSDRIARDLHPISFYPSRLGWALKGLIFVYALSYQPTHLYVNGRRKNSRLRASSAGKEVMI